MDLLKGAKHVALLLLRSSNVHLHWTQIACIIFVLNYHYYLTSIHCSNFLPLRKVQGSDSINGTAFSFFARFVFLLSWLVFSISAVRGLLRHPDPTSNSLRRPCNAFLLWPASSIFFPPIFVLVQAAWTNAWKLYGPNVLRLPSYLISLS